MIRFLLLLLSSACLSRQSHGLKLSTSSSLAWLAPPPQLARWLGSVTLSTAVLISALPSPSFADARLNAPTAAGTRVNSDPDSLLRFGLPITSKELREIQTSVENVKMNLKTRRLAFASSDIRNVEGLLKKYSPIILKEVPPGHQKEAQASLERMLTLVSPVSTALRGAVDSGAGSLQERKGLDDAFAAQEVLAQELSVLEETAVPEGYHRVIPEEYASLPALEQRAVVEFVLKKPDGSQYDVDGNLFDSVKLTMVIDGYNAPITGGNFVDLVEKGFYSGLKITRSDGFVVQTGDPNPEGEVHGFVPKGSSTVRTIPLEVAVKNDPELLYGSTTEDDGRGYAATVLPFQTYGALGMARSEFEADSASSQFFWLLFESDLTPAGKNLLDGRYTCFGYTVDGGDLLKDVKEGDVIVSAKVVKGLDHLKSAADFTK